MEKIEPNENDKKKPGFGSVLAKSIKHKTAKQRRGMQLQIRSLKKKFNDEYGEDVDSAKKKIKDFKDDKTKAFQARQIIVTGKQIGRAHV